MTEPNENQEKPGFEELEGVCSEQAVMIREQKEIIDKISQELQLKNCTILYLTREFLQLEKVYTKSLIVPKEVRV